MYEMNTTTLLFVKVLKFLCQDCNVTVFLKLSISFYLMDDLAIINLNKG